MNPAERALRRVDAFQRRHRAAAFAIGVLKKYGDDNAGALTVQIAYAVFTTVFPLLLVLVTVLGLVLSGDPSARHAVLHSTFSQFPIVGHYLEGNIHALHKSSVVGLVIGLVALLYGATGLASTGQYAMAQVWNLPGPNRPNFVHRLGRSASFLGILGTGVVL